MRTRFRLAVAGSLLMVGRLWFTVDGSDGCWLLVASFWMLDIGNLVDDH